jgi:hypothetical protein
MENFQLNEIRERMAWRVTDIVTDSEFDAMTTKEKMKFVALQLESAKLTVMAEIAIRLGTDWAGLNK